MYCTIAKLKGQMKLKTLQIYQSLVSALINEQDSKAVPCFSFLNYSVQSCWMSKYTEKGRKEKLI